jgi:aerobic carbon-monoxide dehydrogenase large subunit
LRGAAPFVSDLVVEGCFEAAFARSRAAHARLRSVEIAGARMMDGVVAAHTAADLDLKDLGFPPRVEAPDDMKRPVLARDRVRYVGEPFALVIATDRYLAEDAAEACVAHLDPLAACLDPADAEDGEPLFEGTGNLAFVRRVGEPVDDVLTTAPVVVDESYTIGRVVHTALEGRAILVVPSGERLDVWASTQTPHRLRDALARATGRDRESVRIRVPNVGGAFGGKSQTYPEYVAIARAAALLDRPVRWVEDRHEALLTSSHGRGQLQRVRLAAEEDGRLLAADIRVVADLGAYPHNGGAVPQMTLWVLSGCYAIPRLYAEARGVVTNKVPTASYRGAGRPEAAHAIERTMDVLAARVGLDSAELRLRNFIPDDAFPYRSPTGALYDSGAYANALRLALTEVGYEELRREQEARRARGDRVALGIGICSYIERSGGQGGSSEWGRIELLAGGRLRAVSGTSAQGQGHLTALAQIVADAFDVSLDRVEIVQGDTEHIGQGTGTFGSRSIQVGGGALQEASAQVLTQAASDAADLLGANRDDLRYEKGSFEAGGRSITLAAIVDARGEIAREVEFAPPQAFPFGTHVAVVDVDIDTGVVEVRKLVVVDDCGEILNPLLLMGQTIGSAVQGVGQALYERIGYDDEGRPSAGSLIDYSVPTLPVVPPIDPHHTNTPNLNVALGTKGAGEAGCIGVPPAIANAVADALQRKSPAGLDLPLHPERVWRVARGPVSAR